MQKLTDDLTSFTLYFSIRIEPILARIKENRSNVLCPIVDAIMDNTLEYSGNGGYQVGGFTWSMHFTWENVPERDKITRKYTDPVRYWNVTACLVLPLNY